MSVKLIGIAGPFNGLSARGSCGTVGALCFSRDRVCVEYPTLVYLLRMQIMG